MKRSGLSPVVSQIILAAAVLTIGGGVWYFSLGYCSVTTDNYVDETLALISVAIERFTVERVSNSSDASIMKVWINNYGEVDITVDVYADSYDRNSSIYDVFVESENMKYVELNFTDNPMVAGEVYQIKVSSRRQNYAYQQYTVH